ncbi:MAG: phosphatidylserine decarboxylase [Verrucomicrobiota bacterium]
MSTQGRPVEFFDRSRAEVQVEPIYGEKWLRWAYENPLGRLTTRALVSRAVFSRWYGRRMSAPASRHRIAPFLETYQLNPAEFQKNPEDFTSFNDFFTRKLKSETRPVDPDPQRLTFPADGRHLAIPNLATTNTLYVKNQRLSLRNLLPSAVDFTPYKSGAALLSRLCPIDYHRLHFPFAGTPKNAHSIDGPLFSVNPIALRHQITYLLRNKKVIIPFDTSLTPHPLLLVPVGATNVGSIQLTYQPNAPVAKGDEIGCFAFGGSSIITLFPKDTIRFDEDLLTQSAQSRETYAKFGTSFATILPCPW